MARLENLRMQMLRNGKLTEAEQLGLLNIALLSNGIQEAIAERPVKMGEGEPISQADFETKLNELFDIVDALFKTKLTDYQLKAFERLGPEFPRLVTNFRLKAIEAFGEDDEEE